MGNRQVIPGLSLYLERAHDSTQQARIYGTSLLYCKWHACNLYQRDIYYRYIGPDALTLVKKRADEQRIRPDCAIL
jgi:hypothetical protein